MRPQGTVITDSVTQFEFPICESIGLLKVDFLGLSTLTVLRKAAELIQERHGLEFTLENIPMDNPEEFKELPDFPAPDKAFELLAKGDVTGVFQVEGNGMRRVLREMKPTRFEHIVAAISLFRPGPMEYIPTYIARMHGREKVEFKHAKLESILSETYGIIVYQEQIIQVAAQLAGYAPGEADQIRKAVGKKIKSKIEEHRSKFVAGAVNNGIDQADAEAIYGDIEFFARYGFNKAHAADYALVTCQTAYLKAHFPLEYMTALLTVERGNTDKVGMLVGECRAMGLEVLPPSVNHSGIEFVIEDRDGPEQEAGIRFGLSAVKNVGEGPVAKIVAARATDEGKFADIDNLCSRVDLRQVGRRALEGLIKVGALDCFASRHHLLAIIDRMINLSSSMHKASSVGQMTMFDQGGFDAPQIGSILYPEPDGMAEIPQREMLSWEKELAGTYLSNHPIQRFMPAIKAANTTLLGELDETMHGQQVTVAGLVSFVRHHQTRKGDPMAFVEIEDIQTSREIVVFPRAFEAHSDLLVTGNLIIVRGKVDAPEGRPPKVLADSLTNELTTYSAVGESPGTYEAPPAEPLPLFEKTALAPVSTAGQEVQNGHQNGHSDLPAEKSSLATSSEPGHQTTARPDSQTPGERSQLQPQAHRLHITLTRTGSLAQDKHRLKSIYDLLKETPGNDQFVFYIPNGHEKIQIEFPNQTTHYTAHLEQQLVQILGAKAVRVE
jgi:DNA polymerase-3 subunit alpha